MRLPFSMANKREDYKVMHDPIAAVHDIIGQIDGWEKVEESQMEEFIDGPYCPPSSIEVGDGTFDH